MPRARRERALAALVLLAACGRGLPEPDAEERAALAAAAVVAPEPSAGCRAGTSPRVRGARRTLIVGGEERGYLIDAPAAPGDRPLPLVLDFHGFRGSAQGQRWWTGMGRLALRDGFIAVHPEGHDGVRLLGTAGRGWDIRPDEARDAGFVRTLLDRFEQERCVDRRRVFATGMSNGVFFASLLGCVAADRAGRGGARPARLRARPARAHPVRLRPRRPYRARRDGARCARLVGAHRRLRRGGRAGRLHALHGVRGGRDLLRRPAGASLAAQRHAAHLALLPGAPAALSARVLRAWGGTWSA